MTSIYCTFSGTGGLNKLAVKPSAYSSSTVAIILLLIIVPYYLGKYVAYLYDKYDWAILEPMVDSSVPMYLRGIFTIIFLLCFLFAVGAIIGGVINIYLFALTVC